MSKDVHAWAGASSRICPVRTADTGVTGSWAGRSPSLDCPVTSQCPLWNRQPVIWAVHGVLRVIQDRASAAIAHTAWPRVQNFPAITAPEPSHHFHHRYRGRGILGSGHCITANQYNCGSLQPMACSRASDPDLPGVRLLQNGNQRATPPWVALQPRDSRRDAHFRC